MEPRWLTTDLLERVTDGFVFIDRALRFVFVNEAAARLLDASPASLVGRCVWDVFPQPRTAPFRAAVERVLETDRSEDADVAFAHRGSLYQTRIYPSAPGLTVLLRDAGARGREGGAGAESDARFQKMADAAPVMIWMADRTQARTYLNARWLAFTGSALEDEVGDGWVEGVHPDDRGYCLDIYASAFGRAEPFRMEYRLRHHDGRYRWIMDHGVPRFDDDGAFAGYVGSCVDVHDRREAEQRLEFLVEASRILASTLDYEMTLGHIARLVVPQMADWCVIELVEPDGEVKRSAAHADPEKVRRIRELHERYPADPDAPHGVGRVLRTGQPELVSEVTDETLVEAARDPVHLQLMRDVGFRSMLTVPLTVRGRTLGTLQMVWADGDYRYNEAEVFFARELAGRAAVAIDNAQLYQKARAAEADLTALNESLEWRVQERTEELRQRNRELQEFAFVASHDLQEPLRKISSFASLLRSEHGGQFDGAALEYLNRMEHAATRMARLIRALLSFSRIASRGGPFRRVDLNDVARDVLSALEVQVEEAGAVIHVESLPEVEADPAQMHQLLQNLVSNAIKYRRSDVDPVVRVSASVEDGGRGAKEHCRLQVEDNGIGFEEKYLDRIFAPFQRLHGLSEYEGTGMGLAIVRRIVERHGGTITAESAPGRGSRFLVTLPCRRDGRA